MAKSAKATVPVGDVQSFDFQGICIYVGPNRMDVFTLRETKVKPQTTADLAVVNSLEQAEVHDIPGAHIRIRPDLVVIYPFTSKKIKVHCRLSRLGSTTGVTAGLKESKQPITIQSENDLRQLLETIEPGDRLAHDMIFLGTDKKGRVLKVTPCDEPERLNQEETENCLADLNRRRVHGCSNLILPDRAALELMYQERTNGSFRGTYKPSRHRSSEHYKGLGSKLGCIDFSAENLEGNLNWNGVYRDEKLHARFCVVMGQITP